MHSATLRPGDSIADTYRVVAACGETALWVGYLVREASADVPHEGLGPPQESDLFLKILRPELFPDRAGMTMPEAVRALSEPEDFARALVEAGYRDPRIEPVTFDFILDVAALDAPDTLFGMSPDWTALDEVDKAAVIAEVRRMAGDRSAFPIPSTALIAVAER